MLSRRPKGFGSTRGGVARGLLILAHVARLAAVLATAHTPQKLKNEMNGKNESVLLVNELLRREPSENEPVLFIVFSAMVGDL